MSTNEQEHSLAQDEAFIESLYAELEPETTSAEMDAAILAAAHTAVKPKRPAWLLLLASAASLLLVVMLGVHQLFDPQTQRELAAIQPQQVDDLQPMDEAMPLPARAQQEMAAPRLAEKKLRSEAAPAQRTAMLQAQQKEESRALSDEIAEADSEMLAGTATVVAEPPVDMKSSVSASEAKAKAAAPAVVAALADPLAGAKALTHEQYQVFAAHGAQWELVKEDEKNYWLRIDNLGRPELYRISRNEYLIRDRFKSGRQPMSALLRVK